MKMTKSSRIAVALAMVTLAACSDSSGPPIIEPGPVTQEMPLTGAAVPSMSNVDVAVSKLMSDWHIPGGAVGVMKDGRLVYARGFGYADLDAQKQAAPDALFRIASVSKPVTKAAILMLVQQGKFSLETPAFSLLPNLSALPGVSVDPRLATITVRHLVDHTGGWDRDMSGDPMFLPTQIAAATGTPAPASAESIVRYMMGKPLDFNPGSRYAYSNFGYAVLGRIIERVSGKGYEQFVKETILSPAGVTRMQLGRTLYANRLPDEVRYYDIFSAPSVFPGVSSPVPAPYGGFNLEAMDSHGGWVASTIDLLRFEKMWITAPPQGLWMHDGALAGTYSIMVRTSTGLAWVALFNARDMGGNSQFQAKAGAVLQQAITAVTGWPTHDLFTTFQ